MLATQHVLVINPNTSVSVTERLMEQLSSGLPEVQVHGGTAPFGNPYIADEYSFCVAGHAVLQAWQEAQAVAPAPGYGAVLVGCFGDPGLDALRELTAAPVLGLAEASVRCMAQQGFARIGIVTGGQTWKPMLERWSRASGYAHPGSMPHIVQVQALATTGLQMMQSPESTARTLAQASAAMLQDGSVQAVLLGGAGLVGMGACVRELTGLPVWDCVEAVQPCMQQVLEAPRRSIQ